MKKRFMSFILIGLVALGSSSAFAVQTSEPKNCSAEADASDKGDLSVNSENKTNLPGNQNMGDANGDGKA